MTFFSMKHALYCTAYDALNYRRVLNISELWRSVTQKLSADVQKSTELKRANS